MIATQTFGLGKLMAGNLEEAVNTLQSLGFDGIEPYLLLNEKQGKMPPQLFAFDRMAQLKKIMDAKGMVIPSAHVGIGFGGLMMPTGMVIKKLKKAHEVFGIRYFVTGGMFSNKKGAKKWAKVCAKIAQALKPLGCTLVYHNHDSEFNTVTVNGKTVTALDYFLELAGPDVMLQIDIGWVAIHADEVEVIKKYRDRLVSIHLKDMYDGCRDYIAQTMPVEKFAPIGEGVIKTAEVLALLDQLPLVEGRVIIDQDKSVGDMMDDLRLGCSNVRKMLAGERI